MSDLRSRGAKRHFSIKPCKYKKKLCFTILFEFSLLFIEEKMSTDDRPASVLWVEGKVKKTSAHLLVGRNVPALRYMVPVKPSPMLSSVPSASSAYNQAMVRFLPSLTELKKKVIKKKESEETQEAIKVYGESAFRVGWNMDGNQRILAPLSPRSVRFANVRECLLTASGARTQYRGHEEV